LISNLIQFAAQDNPGGEAASGGISSLGLNLKSFLFQLITFLIVLAILRKWVFPKLVATLEERRKVLEQSLEQAKQTEETLRRTEANAEAILNRDSLMQMPAPKKLLPKPKKAVSKPPLE
jgi:hypothetical protein